MNDSKAKTVLIVDDSNTMRMLIKMVLKKTSLGIKMMEAVNGTDALKKLQEHDIDLVITDMMMPVMNGKELIRTIRSEVSKDLPIIIVTTLGEEESRDEGLALGANGYIVKPVNGSELISTIENMICQKNA